MNKEKGIAHILLILVILVAVVLGIYFVARQTNLLPKTSFQIGQTKDPTVSLQTQYQNPFDENSQYVNPFSEYKNPFDSLK